MDNLKEALHLENDKPIPADFNIPYFIHEECVYNEQVHTKRWFKAWIATFIVLIVVITGFIVKDIVYQDVVITESMQDGMGTNIINGGDLDYGAEDKDS